MFKQGDTSFCPKSHHQTCDAECECFFKWNVQPYHLTSAAKIFHLCKVCKNCFLLSLMITHLEKSGHHPTTVACATFGVVRCCRKPQRGVRSWFSSFPSPGVLCWKTIFAPDCSARTRGSMNQSQCPVLHFKKNDEKGKGRGKSAGNYCKVHKGNRKSGSADLVTEAGAARFFRGLWSCVWKGVAYRSVLGIKFCVFNVEFARVQEANLWWSMYLNILEARANSRFYKGLLKLQCIHSATGS